MECIESFIKTTKGPLYTKTWVPESPGSTPLLLLHDSLGCVETWRDFPAKLATQLSLRVIAYDRLGFGKSAPRQELPSPHFIREEAEVYLPQIAAQLGLKKFLLFGHSVGGGMALEAAALHPQVIGVISESAQAFVEDRTRQGIAAAQKDFQAPERINRLKKYHGTKADWVLRAWTEVWLSSAFADWTLAKTLPQVQCPVLIIHGEKDEFGSVKFPDMIADLTSGPAQKIILPNCGHVPHKEQPEIVLSQVKEFFEKI